MSSGILGLLGGNPQTTGILGGGLLSSNFADAMASPQAAQQYQPGFLAGLGHFVDNNNSALLGMGAALLDGQGWGGGVRAFMDGQRIDNATRLVKQKQHEAEQKKVAYQQLAQKLGRPELADMPEVLNSLALDAYKKREPTEWERLTQGLSADELQKARRYRLGLETKPETTDDMVEYELAKKDPEFAKFLRSQKGGANAPSGYTYGPDGKLAPIPGGPQDPERDINEPLPGELAARFGLANEFFKRFDRIEGDLKSKDPRLVGPIDRQGFGQSGALQRDLKLGSEAMVRMLTGAGMNKEEAENEVKQYLPGRYDDAATVLDKAYRLRSALRSMQREALAGRRSRRQIEADYPEYASPEFSEIDRQAGRGSRGPIGTNRATYGATPGSGRTTTGVPWSYSR